MDRSNSKTGLKIPLAPKWHSINWWNVVKETSYIIDHMKQMSFLCYFEKISRIPSKKTFTLSTKFWKKKQNFETFRQMKKSWYQNYGAYWNRIIFESERLFLKVDGHFWKWKVIFESERLKNNFYLSGIRKQLNRTVYIRDRPLSAHLEIWTYM